MPLTTVSLVTKVVVSYSSIPDGPPSPTYKFDRDATVHNTLVTGSYFGRQLGVFDFSYVDSLIVLPTVSLAKVYPIAGTAQGSSFVEVVETFSPSPGFYSVCSMYPKGTGSSS